MVWAPVHLNFRLVSGPLHQRLGVSACLTELFQTMAIASLTVLISWTLSNEMKHEGRRHKVGSPRRKTIECSE
jgi:hypothetical protein